MASNGVVEHSAKGDTVDRAGLQAKPNDPTSVLIHDDQYPVSPQHCRFAAKEVHVPETVLHVTKECQPGRTTSVWLGSVIRGQDAPNDVFIDGDAERPSNLLGNAMRGQPQKGLRCLVATIASMSSWDGPLGPGLGLPFGEKSRRYLRLVRIW